MHESDRIPVPYAEDALHTPDGQTVRVTWKNMQAGDTGQPFVGIFDRVTIGVDGDAGVGGSAGVVGQLGPLWVPVLDRKIKGRGAAVVDAQFEALAPEVEGDETTSLTVVMLFRSKL